MLECLTKKLAGTWCKKQADGYLGSSEQPYAASMNPLLTYLPI